MVESRVVVPNAASVHGHMRRLDVASGGSSVSFDGAQKQFPVRSQWESRRIVQVVHVVEVSPKLRTGDRSYTLIGPVPVRSTR
jgi:hypothetical protein